MKRLGSDTCFFLLCFWAWCSSCHSPSPAGTATTNDFIKDSSAHFILFAQPGVRSQNVLPAMAQQLESVQENLLRLLGEAKPQRLQVYFLKDRATLTSYTGFPANGYTDTEKGILYFVDKAPFHLAFRHETMHALSWRLWGAPRGWWLSEGIAVFASGGCGGYSLHALAQTIHRQGKLVPFQNLTDTFDFKALEPRLQAASFVQYIYDHYGTVALKTIWQSGAPHTQAATGLSFKALEHRWLVEIGQPKYNVAIDWGKIHTRGCE